MINTEHLKAKHIHVVLGHSYIFFFLGGVIGLLLDIVSPYTLPGNFESWGIILMLVGTFLVVWAQNTSRQTHEVRSGKEITHDHFYRGPYKITRSPTHLGLGFMFLGLAFVENSLWMLVTAVLSYFITRYIFIRKEERLLEKKYGAHYLTYKKRVTF